MSTNERPKFTCIKCGGHELVVTHVWNIQARNDSERWREWGPFKDNHHWHFEFKEKSEKNTNSEVQRGDFGEFAENDTVSEPNEYEIHKTETNRESEDFFVNCEYCDRDIEFGWSQPDRRGLILPVDFSDFIPSESWPDPKYVDGWQHRGWLQTGHIQP